MLCTWNSQASCTYVLGSCYRRSGLKFGIGLDHLSVALSVKQPQISNCPTWSSLLIADELSGVAGNGQREERWRPAGRECALAWYTKHQHTRTAVAAEAARAPAAWSLLHRAVLMLHATCTPAQHQELVPHPYTHCNPGQMRVRAHAASQRTGERAALPGARVRHRRLVHSAWGRGCRRRVQHLPVQQSVR